MVFSRFVVNFAKEKTVMLFFLLSFLPLLGAYVSQYGFGLEPCVLCLYQRIPYAMILFVTLFLAVAKWSCSRLVLIVFLLLAIMEFSIAVYHVGVEQGVVVQETGCADEMQVQSLEEMRAQLFAKPNVACDKPQFVFLGLSMAGWNSLYACMLMAVSFFLIKTKAKKK